MNSTNTKIPANKAYCLLLNGEFFGDGVSAKEEKKGYEKDTCKEKYIYNHYLTPIKQWMSEGMNGVSGHNSALLRLYWVGDKMS